MIEVNERGLTPAERSEKSDRIMCNTVRFVLGIGAVAVLNSTYQVARVIWDPLPEPQGYKTYCNATHTLHALAQHQNHLTISRDEIPYKTDILEKKLEGHLLVNVDKLNDAASLVKKDLAQMEATNPALARYADENLKRVYRQIFWYAGGGTAAAIVGVFGAIPLMTYRLRRLGSTNFTR